MPDRHCALIVEDNERTAADLAEILRGVDCDSVIARSKEEALNFLEARPRCVILLDLQIPRTARGIRSESAVGISLLEDIRRLFGGRLRRQTWIPVIVVSGHAGDPTDVAELMKLDADDVIQKPYDIEDVAGKVREALDRSGRTSHDNCRSMVGGSPTKCLIEIPGTAQKRRTIALIGGKEAKLRDVALCALLRLLIGRARNESVPLIAFSSDRSCKAVSYKALDRLREDLRHVLDDPTTFIINTQGSYALPEGVSIGAVNTESLVRLGNQIAELAHQLETARNSRGRGAAPVA